jgi:hypothetical protein
MTVRVRRAQFSGQEDKWMAPHDDIRNCMPAIIRAGLEMAYACRPELQDGLCACAGALAIEQNLPLRQVPIPALHAKLREQGVTFAR